MLQLQRQVVRMWQLLLLFLLFPCPGNAHAENGDNDLHRINAIKAAFVLNIARFVTWPSEAFSSENDPIHLCLYRDNAYGNDLEAINGKKIGQRNLQLSTIDHLSPSMDCEILLIPSSASEKFNAEFSGSVQQPLLTIADRTGGDEETVLRKGIIVTLVRKGPRIAFEIDPWLAKRVNLHMSSELLKLATIVGGEQ